MAWLMQNDSAGRFKEPCDGQGARGARSPVKQAAPELGVHDKV